MDEQRKIDKLYELLEEKERKKDTEAASALEKISERAERKAE